MVFLLGHLYEISMQILVPVCCVLLLTACGGGGETNSSAPIIPDNSDITAPAPPSLILSDNDDGRLSISGSAEAESSVEVIFPDLSSSVVESSQGGSFGPITSKLPQPNGDVLATATDSAGNISVQVLQTYNDLVAPLAPVQSISVNSDGTLSVMGNAEAQSSIHITFPDGSQLLTHADNQSKFASVTSELPQTTGQIMVLAEDINGNQSAKSIGDFVDSFAPLVPTVNIIINENNTVSVGGIAEAGSIINIAFHDGTNAIAMTSLNRLFGPVISQQAQVSGSVEVTSTDLAGNVSNPQITSYEIAAESMLWELVNDPNAQDIVRFLTQATFGATEDDIQKLVAISANYDTWVTQQIAAQPTNLLDNFEQRLRDAGLPVTSRANLDFAYHKQLIASDVLWDTFAYAEDQLRQRVAFALSQIFVVSDTSDTLFNNAKGVVAYHDLLATHALGNYRDLIEAVTLNPIMGEYLSMIRNEKVNNEENIRPDENYAREMMQLFSIGLVMLNADGSITLDDDGRPIPTYNQDVIKSFASVFTGWTYSNATFWDFDGWLFGDTINALKAFETQHDDSEKILLNGQVLPAGQSAYDDLQGALDNLFEHPNVPPFIGKQLIQLLVTSNPSPAYVARVSAVFRDNGEGIRGDLGAVVKAILLDEEARAGHINEPSKFGKLKEPVLKFTALIRAFNVIGYHPINASGTLRPILRYYLASAASGQRPYGAPSVFNFFRPDHSPSGPIRDAGLVAPELQILNESFITEATNYGSAAIFNSYDFLLDDCHQRIEHLDGFGCPYAQFDQEIALANNLDRLLDRLNLLMLAGEMSSITADALIMLAQQQNEPRFSVAEIVHLIYISPEFAVQR